MSTAPADIDETLRGVRIRMRGVPAWVCPNCGQKQLALPVARYVSEYLRRLLTNLPEPPDGFPGPLTPTEVVFN